MTRTTSRSTAATSSDPLTVEPPWRPDILPGYECRELALGSEAAGDEPEPPVATLVRRAGAQVHERAALYIHGWNDYFFHTHVVDWFDERGCTMYGIDLRRCGRSRREGQLAGYIDALGDYFAELDAALAVLEADHDEVVVVGHSTGGLVASLWADARPRRLAGLVLNSPWLDLWGPPGMAKALRPVLGTLSRRNAYSVIPLPEGDTVYARTLHQQWGGAWDYSLELKSPTGVPIRVGWLRAVLKGQARVAKGLSIDCPVFVATSARSWFGRTDGKKSRSSDIVLDVKRITAQAWRLGRLVTVARVPGGVHDLFLSAPEPRRQLFADLGAWLGAYVE